MTLTANRAKKNTIVDQMRVPPTKHDLAWLKTSLQAAVELELSTIPPYLCAMWSVKDPDDPVRAMIRDIVLEEMGHLGTACNMLTAIGGTPVLTTPDVVPVYPGPLPGGVRPYPTVSLVGLTPQVVRDTFMEIELPETGPTAFSRGQAFPTIGAFYDAISAAFQNTIDPGDVTGHRQIVAGFDGAETRPVATVEQAVQAIKHIKEQGEGGNGSPIGDTGEQPPVDDLGHYFQFGEIYHGRRFIQVDGVFDYVGDPIDFPKAWPMAVVPPEGYPQDSAEFDTVYARLLGKLEETWTTGEVGPLNAAIFGEMEAMGALATALMRRPRPDGQGNLGPDFQLR
jgi:hypothetical protein